MFTNRRKKRIFFMTMAVALSVIAIVLAVFVITKESNTPLNSNTEVPEKIEENPEPLPPPEPSFDMPEKLSIDSDSVDSISLVVVLGGHGKLIDNADDISQICDTLNRIAIVPDPNWGKTSTIAGGGQAWFMYFNCKTGENFEIHFSSGLGQFVYMFIENPNSSVGERPWIPCLTTLSIYALYGSLDYEEKTWNWEEERFED